jgi:TonB-linked SusC/RagA family outer membrane protein
MKEFFPGKYTGTYNLFNRKILLIMRLTAILLILGTMLVQASGYAQKVNISVKDANIESVFKEIKKQTGFYFLYDAEVLKKAGKINLISTDLDLTEALKQITSGTGLTYKIIDKTVIISDVKTSYSNVDITIKGTVTSKEAAGHANLPLPGAVVTVKGTRNAVVTNSDGNYTIQAPDGGILVFSILGYGTKEVAIEGKKTIDVTLLETASDLNEVIITAYGTKETKENQVGSAFKITSKDLEMRPTNRLDALLEGIVPGLQYEAQSGGTSSARPRFQTRIRGESSFGASNEPLWVVDGIKINTGDETNMIMGANTSISPLSYLNPNDIESITILKDATATSIYGADGANGVILINTKKGYEGKPMVNYSFRTGINLLTNNRFNMLTASEYRELEAESFANTSLAVNEVKDKGGDTDWYDVFFRNGITTQQDISVRGGNGKTGYFISASYFNEKPIMIANETDRFSTRINLDQKVGKSINLRLYMGASRNINDLFTPGNAYYINRPIDSPYNPDGSLVLAFYNQLADAKYNEENQKTNAFNGGIGGDIKIFPGLKYTTTNGIDYSGIHETRYGSLSTWSNRNEAEAHRANTNNFFWNSQHRFNYEKTFNKHDIAALIGGEAESRTRKTKYRDGSGFASDDIRNVDLAQEIKDSFSKDEQTAVSYYGQARYSFDKKYNLVASYRADANSNFGSDVRWATFSSVGASWTISNEKWWKMKQVDFAKLKLSYGTNGNSRIGAYKSKGIYTVDQNQYYNDNPGAYMTTGENPILSWETTYIINGGVSLGLFKRISLDIELYQNTTKNLINDVDVSRTNGFTGILQNLGEVRNSGIEINLNTQNILSKNFEWTTSFNLAHNNNEILKLYNGEDKVAGTSIRRVGEDLNNNYLIRWAGVDPRDGAPMWYDARGNITREFDLNNRVLVGASTPDFFGGMKNTFRFGDIYLSALMIYNVGGYAFSDFQRDAESDGRNLLSDNQSRNQLNRWREAGDLALAPKTILNENANSGRNSSRFLHKKTSLRLTNINASYNLPKEFLERIKLKRSSVYIQADNVGFWTPYHTEKGFNDYKNSFNPYPQPLVISFGLNVGI